jgi:hypothetical protein
MMSAEHKKTAPTCESILALLSGAEVGKVSRAEDAPPPIEGDEYVDLERLVHGTVMSRVRSRLTGGVSRRAR